MSLQVQPHSGMGVTSTQIITLFPCSQIVPTRVSSLKIFMSLMFSGDWSKGKYSLPNSNKPIFSMLGGQEKTLLSTNSVIVSIGLGKAIGEMNNPTTKPINIINPIKPQNSLTPDSLTSNISSPPSLSHPRNSFTQSIQGFCSA